MKKLIPILIICLVNSAFVYSQTKPNQEEILITSSGWGIVQLGASKKAVEKVLGKPEVLDPVSDVIFADYASKGLQVSYLTKTKTVNAIFFYNNERLTFVKYGIFLRGRTDKGIDWNSTQEELIKIYGKPKEDYKGEDSGGTWRRIVYKGMDFRFENEKLVRISVFIETEDK